MAARSEEEVIEWAQDNQVYRLLLEGGFTPRELEEVRFACNYASEFLHGTDGHLRLLIIAKLTEAVFEISETIGVHGHMLKCPDCHQQLTSLLLCTKCGRRFELDEQGTRAALEWASQNMSSAYDDIISHMNHE